MTGRGRTPRLGLATYAGVAALLLAVIVPKVAHAPAGVWALEEVAFAATSVETEEPPRPLLAAATTTRSNPARARAVLYRPARMIDDALRRRAYEAVQRAIEEAQEAPV